MDSLLRGQTKVKLGIHGSFESMWDPDLDPDLKPGPNINVKAGSGSEPPPQNYFGSHKSVPVPQENCNCKYRYL
jgi:hypothetical protein